MAPQFFAQQRIFLIEKLNKHGFAPDTLMGPCKNGNENNEINSEIRVQVLQSKIIVLTVCYFTFGDIHN